MPMRPLFLLVILMLAPQLSAATVIEVPVPGLTGAYFQNGVPEGAARTANVQLPSMPSIIHGVSLRVHGTSAPGLFSCDSQNGMQPRWIPTFTGASFAVPVGYMDVNHGGDTDTAGVFTWTEAFEAHNGATWSFLLDGSADLTVGSYCGTPIMECYPQEPGASLTLDAVTLIVDGEFPTPANVSTWGRIKAQYR